MTLSGQARVADILDTGRSLSKVAGLDRAEPQTPPLTLSPERLC